MSTSQSEFTVRLTKNENERKQVRQLRYRCFCLENGAAATDEQKKLKEEWDNKDEHAEYMAVFHGKKIVATYRILNRANAKKMGGFYTESPDCGRDIRKIKKLRGNIVEMSRACVEME
ncbi:MAG: GNAT family N-acetyltransferase, partial [Alphaproteobacteria bacterium]|nr:GNAT family N-acetyltransferase [Alphaproteobacteria bacterium]